jgi:hypothetical protein
MHATGLDITGGQIGELSAPDAIAAFLDRLVGIDVLDVER